MDIIIWDVGLLGKVVYCQTDYPDFHFGAESGLKLVVSGEEIPIERLVLPIPSDSSLIAALGDSTSAIGITLATSAPDTSTHP